MEKPLPFRVQAHNTDVDLQRFASVDEALAAIVEAKPKHPVMLETVNWTTSKYTRVRYKPIATSIWKTQKRTYDDPSWGYDASEGPLYGELVYEDKTITWEIPMNPTKKQPQ